MPRHSADAATLRELLLVPGLVRGVEAREPCRRIPTGLATLDALLGGGLLRGALTEIVGPPSTGRTTLAWTLMRAVTMYHGLAAYIDLPDAFDATNTELIGIDPARILWIRPRTVREALQAAAYVLDAGGFGVVLVDLDTRHALRSTPTSSWLRLTRVARHTGTAMVVLGRENVAGTFAALRLEVARRRARFDARATCSLLSAIISTVHLRKSRLGTATLPPPIAMVARP